MDSLTERSTSDGMVSEGFRVLLGSYADESVARSFIAAARLGGIIASPCYGYGKLRKDFRNAVALKMFNELELVFERPFIRVFRMSPRLIRALLDQKTQRPSLGDMWNVFDRCLLLSAIIEDEKFEAQNVNFHRKEITTEEGIWKFSSMQETLSFEEGNRYKGVIGYQFEKAFVPRVFTPAWGKSKYVNSFVRATRGMR